MQVVITGSGNVAYHMAKAFVKSGISLIQIFGRNETELRKISDETGVPFSTQDLADADFYFVCVSDNAVESVSKLITNQKALVAHSSGSLPKEILSGDYRKASFYPLQTFTKEKTLDYSEIPFFVDAENMEDESQLILLAEKISKRVMKSSYEKRKYIHLTAVFACNFVNHLFARAKEISDSQEIPFEYFLPLIDETLQKINEIDPKMAQTGPAVRNDTRIMQLHQELLKDEALKIYTTLNESIKEMYNLK